METSSNIANTEAFVLNESRGRHARVSDEQVIAVGEQLERDGKRVSGYLIRAALGGVGRTDRYSELWSKHVSARAAGASEPVATASPVALPTEIRAALDEAQAFIGSALEALAMSVQRHTNEVNEARIGDADRRAAEAEAARAEVEKAGEEAMDASQAEIECLTGELEAARKAAAESEHAHQQAEGRAKERAEKLAAAEARERQARDENTLLQAQITELRRAGEALAKELASSKDTVRQLEHDKGVAETQAAERARALEVSQKRAETLETSVTDSQRRADAAQARADEAQARADKAGEREHAEIERARAIEEARRQLEDQLRTQVARVKELEGHLAKEVK